MCPSVGTELEVIPKQQLANFSVSPVCSRQDSSFFISVQHPLSLSLLHGMLSKLIRERSDKSEEKLGTSELLSKMG